MSEFIRFYGWGVNMKFHMAIYTLALTALEGLVQWLMGKSVIPIMTLLEMMIVSLIISIIESLIFPQEGSWEGASMVRHTALWAVVCNVGFIGGTVVFHWFSGVPVWAAVLLILLLEGGLASMWFAMHVALKKDTEKLNQKLMQYKNMK